MRGGEKETKKRKKKTGVSSWNTVTATDVPNDQHSSRLPSRYAKIKLSEEVARTIPDPKM